MPVREAEAVVARLVRMEPSELVELTLAGEGGSVHGTLLDWNLSGVLLEDADGEEEWFPLRDVRGIAVVVG